MSVTVREYTKGDLPELRQIWNGIVEEGNSFPQAEPLNEEQAERFFAEQIYTGAAEVDGEIVGLYILHPNNIGRCGHIANASYAVKAGQRGKHVGERLVKDSLEKAVAFSFRVMQFNAVVASNEGAIHLYEKLGFQRLGTVPGGFQMKDGAYADIILFYIDLDFGVCG